MEHVETLGVTLVRSKYDEAAFSPNYQRELKQFYHLVRAGRTRINATLFTMPGVSTNSGFTGEFALPLSQEIGPELARAGMAWRNSQTGRILRLTLGSLEFDLGIPSDFETILQRAQTLLEREDRSIQLENPKT